MFLLLSIASLILICTLYLYYHWTPEQIMISKIPGPKGWPIIGNSMDLLKGPEELFLYIRKLNKEYGTIYKFRGLNLRSLNITSPDDVETIISTTQFHVKPLPYNFLHIWLGNGLLISSGELWHNRRKLLTPAFHFNILKKFTRSFNDHTRNFLHLVEAEVGVEKTELNSLISKTTLRVMCDTSMGIALNKDTSSISDKYFESLTTLIECLVYRVARVWTYSDFIFNWTKTATVTKSALEDLHKFTKKIIKERRAYREDNHVEDLRDGEDVYGKKVRMAMLDLLLEEEKKGRIDEDGIREEVDTFMFEGHDTTAAALCFMIMRIANEKEVQESLHNEIETIFGDSDRDPTMEDLNQMKYLECCIKESLRLYPSVPFIARYLDKEVVLGGYKIPTNTICNIHVFDIHRNASLYPDPEKFIPERFLPENCSNRHPYAYIPFSAGPRNCIGQKFAMLEMKTLMSGLLRKFHLEPITRPEDITFKIDLVLRSVSPLYVRFCRRNRKCTH